MKILKIGKSSKFVVECDWNSKTSQNVQFFPWNWWIFRKKINNLEIGKSCKFVSECDWNSKTSQNVRFFS